MCIEGHYKCDGYLPHSKDSDGLSQTAEVNTRLADLGDIGWTNECPMLVFSSIR